MTKLQAWLLHLSVIVLTVTGVVFAWMKYWMKTDDPFSLVEQALCDLADEHRVQWINCRDTQRTLRERGTEMTYAQVALMDFHERRWHDCERAKHLVEQAEHCDEFVTRRKSGGA